MNTLRLLDHLLSDFSAGTHSPVSHSLNVDLYEENDKYVLEADLPGMKKEDLKIEFKNGYLTLSGKRERKVENNGKERGYYYKERSFGHFEKSYYFGQGINEKEISASFEDGVLKVSLTKKEEEVSRLISIN